MTTRTNRYKRFLMPKKRAIYNHWKDRGEELGRNGVGYYDLDYMGCFACGSVQRLERCHIIPLVFEGSNALENLHILCSRCHIESEGLKRYWQWLSYKRLHEWKDPTSHFIELLKKCGIDFEKESKSMADSYSQDPSKTPRDALDELFAMVFIK